MSKLTGEEIIYLCDWGEQDVTQYRKGPATGGVGPMRYYIKPGGMIEKLEKLDVRVEIARPPQRLTVTRTEIENAVGDTSDEYTEGVVELFESKGFEVE